MTPANLFPPPLVANDSAALQLWRWWTRELKSMLPAPIAGWLDGDAVATNIFVDDQALTIADSSQSPSAPSAAKRVPLDALASSPVLRELIAAGHDRVRLVLTPDQVMVKTITLPLATEENLREVVGFELDRHTPFTPDQAYYDVQVVRRDPQQDKIIVSLALAPKVEVAALLETVNRAGLACTAIGVSAAAAVNAAAFDLQPAASKPPRRLSRTHQINLGLLGLAALLSLAAVILPIWQKREAVKALIPQADKSAAEFVISERVYTEYVKLASQYNFLVAKKHAVYPVVTVIEELARTFPDSTWVQKLDIKGNGKVREVIMLGEAQSASKVIENLEQSPMSLFQNSKQLTQTTRMQPNSERFHVSAEIKPRAVPAADLVEVAAVASPTLPEGGTTAPAGPSTTLPGVAAPTQGAAVVGTDPSIAKNEQPATATVNKPPVATVTQVAPRSVPQAQSPIQPNTPSMPLVMQNAVPPPQSPMGIMPVPSAIPNMPPGPVSAPPATISPMPGVPAPASPTGPNGSRS